MPRFLAPILALLVVSPTVLAQQPTPIGSIEATGEVYLSGKLVQGTATVFAGDSVRTGPQGAAGIAVTGRGMFVLDADTELTFPVTARFVASLKKGTVNYRAVAGARNFQVEVSGYVAVPGPDVDSAAEITRNADGSAQVNCRSGSMAVIAVEGDQSVFLAAGQAALIRLDASVRRAESAPATQKPQEPAPTQPGKEPPPQAKKSRRGLAILIAVAAGGGGAAAALAGKKKGSGGPVSPSIP